MKKRKMHKKEVSDIARAYSFLTTLALNLVVIIVGTFFVGKHLDIFFGTSPLFLFIFFILGMLASFRNIYVLSIAFLPKPKEKYEYKPSNYDDEN